MCSFSVKTISAQTNSTVNVQSHLKHKKSYFAWRNVPLEEPETNMVSSCKQNSAVRKHTSLLPENTPMLWKTLSVSKMTPPVGQNINKYRWRSSLFHLIDFERTTSPAPYIHTLSYTPPHNQISIWCQGGLRFGVFSFVNTTCQFSLLLTRRLTLAQAWNVILRQANLCSEHIWVCPPGKQAWIIDGHLSRTELSCIRHQSDGGSEAVLQDKLSYVRLISSSQWCC